MSTYRFPSVFLSHGTPMSAFGDDAYQKGLNDFAKSIPKPKALIILSAHSISSDKIHVMKSETNVNQHDFMGFPEELYKIQYQCPGDPNLADLVIQKLVQAGFEVFTDQPAPLDHGIWIPLLHLYPKGDVPVVRVSLPIDLSPALILKMGHSIASLREQGIMIMGSGGAVNNLRAIKWSEKNGAGKPWANHFEAWLLEVLKHKDIEALLASEENPDFKMAHPTTDHFLPILFTVGAALPGDEISIIFKGIEYDSLSMLCFSLNHVQNQSLH